MQCSKQVVQQWHAAALDVYDLGSTKTVNGYIVKMAVAALS